MAEEIRAKRIVSPSYFRPKRGPAPLSKPGQPATINPPNTPLLQYSIAPFLEYADTPTHPNAPPLPRNGQIAIEFGLLRLTENPDSSVMRLNDLASD